MALDVILSHPLARSVPNAPQPPPRAVRAQCTADSGIRVTCHTYDCCCCSLAPLRQRRSRGRTGRRLLA
jgi:hypothetical protein